MSEKEYETKLIKNFVSLQEDLEAKKITEKEFNILLGLLLKMQVNNFVQHQIQHHLNIDDGNKMTYIHYDGHRKYTTA